jgi:hypothetical protein
LANGSIVGEADPEAAAAFDRGLLAACPPAAHAVSTTVASEIARPFTQRDEGFNPYTTAIL